MKLLLFPLQILYTAYALAVFFIGLPVATLLVALISIGNNSRSRRLIWRLLRAWALLFLYATGMPPRKMGVRPERRRYVVVLNHISYLDAVMLFPAVPGYFRPLGKKEMSRIPLFGFMYKQIVLMVDRSSQHSRARSMRLMSRAVRHECNIAIFPEGTFNETGAPVKDFYDGAFRLAVNTGTPVLPVLLADTEDRWHYSSWWKLRPGRNRIVYLPPVSVEGLGTADVSALKEKVKKMMEDEFRKYRNFRV